MKTIKSKAEERRQYVETEKDKPRPVSTKLDLTLNQASIDLVLCRILEISGQKLFGPRFERAAKHRRSCPEATTRNQGPRTTVRQQYKRSPAHHTPHREALYTSLSV